MKITKNTRLSDIQSAFGKQFPHLKIEFYKSGHGEGEGSLSKGMLDVSSTVAEISEKGLEQELQFDGSQKISEFEYMVADKFALSIQVFRRSGNLWLQTTTTDSWTLDEANRKGGHSEQLFQSKPEEF